MSTAAIAILVTIAGIVSAVLVAGIGAVWRMGSKVGGFTATLEAYKEAVQQDRDLHERWTKDVLAAMRELDARIVATCDHFNERMSDFEGRLQAIEARCDERREQSRRFAAPDDNDGTPTPVCR